MISSVGRLSGRGFQSVASPAPKKTPRTPYSKVSPISISGFGFMTCHMLLTKRRLLNILKMPMATRIRFIDIYSLYDDLDANIIENLLEDYDIVCLIKKFDAATGGAAGDGGNVEKKISVEEDNVESARQIIADAVKEGLISNKGRFEA